MMEIGILITISMHRKVEDDQEYAERSITYTHVPGGVELSFCTVSSSDSTL